MAKKYPRPKTALKARVKYDITKYSYSSIKIDQLRMTGEMYKPFEGFWTNSKGDMGWRWLSGSATMTMTRRPCRQNKGRLRYISSGACFRCTGFAGYSTYYAKERGSPRPGQNKAQCPQLLRNEHRHW